MLCNCSLVNAAGAFIDGFQDNRNVYGALAYPVPTSVSCRAGLGIKKGRPEPGPRTPIASCSQLAGDPLTVYPWRPSVSSSHACSQYGMPSAKPCAAVATRTWEEQRAPSGPDERRARARSAARFISSDCFCAHGLNQGTLNPFLRRESSYTLYTRTFLQSSNYAKDEPNPETLPRSSFPNLPP